MRKLKKYEPTKFKTKDSVYNQELADYAAPSLNASAIRPTRKRRILCKKNRPYILSGHLQHR